MSKKKKNKTKTKTLVRVATLVMGLGFAGSTLAIALSSAFSQSNYTASESEQSGDAPSIESQIQMRVSGYEKVLEREPQNITALEGLAQIHLQTNNTAKAIPVLEKMVKYYPERQEFAGILQLIKQQETSQQTEPEQPQEQP
ncbi:tetratricopeptide repeat protein [Waterburya agarophytonicola K14]|uniref:Tetratricopeptide repeat protein n=1 Tax=Waterburya agarophytonicola KI4 TaxID=2874699 RepID=A0A964FG47_9CYAN|nr:tetratricopeptide repeat protein [Waterburya agarophytonicola]MCC0177641.1 tetratricopeptide repeat protein [Waterburya agarophytonicola KI4]